MEKLTGKIEDITFYSSETGFMVFVLEHENGYSTCVGSLPELAVGERVVLTGDWTTHKVYGEQFKVQHYEIEVPTTLEDIERYLSSGIIYGIGSVTAKKLIDEFGEDTLEVLANRADLVASVRGIGKNRAVKICESYKEHIESREVMLKLTHYGLSANQALKMYMAYGGEAVNIIQINPYKIIEDISGIGFKLADELAMRIGIEKDSVYRLEAGIRYVLSLAMGNGHVYLPRDILVRESVKVLGVEENLLADVLSTMLATGYLASEGECIYLYEMYRAECECAKRLIELSHYGKVIRDGERYLSDAVKSFEVELSDEQQSAVEMAIKYPISIITGGPGTGKTTIIKLAIDIFERKGFKFILCAPTGRAAKRMSEATGYNASTIHRLLEYNGESGFSKNEDSPIDTDVIIIDEMSMVDVSLMHNLVKAIPNGTKLIMIGDSDQLMPVGPGSVLLDMIESKCIQMTRLTRIYRQGEGSGIVTTAHKINKGEMPELKKDGDCVFAPMESTNELLAKLMHYFKVMKKKVSKEELFEIQVLSPSKKGDLGVINLNKKLQEVINPPTGLPEKKVGDCIFRIDDKVMQIKNNYQIEWENEIDDDNAGVFNGDLGRISNIDPNNETLTVHFDDGKVVEYPFSDIDQLTHAFCMSVHKSQGSEFDTLLFVVTGPMPLMTRNLLYTGVTRAKNKLYLLGSRSSIATMVDNNFISKRYTNFKKFLIEENNRILGV